MKIGIVILNYLNWKDTVDCIESLFLQTDQEFEMVVVDNYSKNETVKILTEKYQDLKNFHLIETKENLGFAKGNNVGLRYCIRDLKVNNVLVINNDVIFTDKEYIHKLKQLPLNNNIGAYGTKIIGLDGLNQNPLKFNPGPYEVLREYLFPIIKNLKNTSLYRSFKKTKNTPNVSENKTRLSNEGYSNYILHGSVLYFTQNYLSILEGFYPETFLYYEENILGLLFKKIGLEMEYIDNLEILHKEDQSSSLSFNNESGVKYRFGRESVKIALKVLLLSLNRIKKITNNYSYNYEVIVSNKSK